MNVMGKKNKMSGALKAFLKKYGHFPKAGQLRKRRLKASGKPKKVRKVRKTSRSSGVRHTAKSKGLFGLGIPKLGDIIQTAYVADRFGAFAALDTLTNATSTDDMNTRLKNAGDAVIGRVTSVGNIITTIITGAILRVGIKMARKIGGKYARDWL